MLYATVRNRLDAGKRVILDGGVGTELERRGADMNPRAWCGAAALDNTALLEEVHRSYLEAGADVITANTYASSRIMLAAAGLDDRVEDINRNAIDAAHRARRAHGREDVAIAGSLSHAAPVAPGTDKTDRSSLPSPVAFEDALGELATILKDAGCDLLVLEMLYDPVRIAPVMRAAKTAGLPVWAGFSARRGADGRMLAFDQARDTPFADVLAALDICAVSAAGVMHTPADLTGEALNMLRDRFSGPLTAYPDSGYFKMPHWHFEDTIAPRALADFARGWAEDQGVQVLGGCCGLGPEHIAALAPLRDATAPEEVGEYSLR